MLKTVFQITKILLFAGQKTVGQGTEEEKRLSHVHVLPKIPRAKQQKPLHILGKAKGLRKHFSFGWHCSLAYTHCLRLAQF